MAHDAAWGRFDAVEAFCIQQGLPFTRCTDGRADLVAHRIVFTGDGVPFAFAVDLDDVPLIDRATVARLGNVEAILAYFGAADFAVPALEVDAGNANAT